MCVRPDNQDVGLEAFKECVTAHWSSGHAPTIHGAKRCAEAAECINIGRGASPARRSRRATDGGAQGSEDAGMSNESGAGNAAAVSPRFPGQG